jgi:DNA-binding response OmpR family regulator
MSSLSNEEANGSAQANKSDANTADNHTGKKRNTFPDRLVADPETLDRLRTFVEQATAHFEGSIKPTRSDVVNAILTHHSETLSPEEFTFLWKKCFNPVRFLKSTAAQMQLAQERGESVTLDQVIERIRKSIAEPQNSATTKRRRPRVSETEAPQKEEP